MLIDVLSSIGLITKLSATYLGLTVIAIGNALPDALVTVALAKDGYAVI
jgi:Ca2+/Na+ antiporter